ncbi:MAG: hypothetical protein GX321_10700 [Clostridiales bacterium]|nr:hypothetical protein [Clostridiales bacterium]
MQFSGRRHTHIGILSAVIGILVVIGFIALCLVSGFYGGEAGIIIGIVGILLFLIALIGFVLSCKAVRQFDIYYRFPVIGITLNGVMMIILMIIYILGFL